MINYRLLESCATCQHVREDHESSWGGESDETSLFCVLGSKPPVYTTRDFAAWAAAWREWAKEREVRERGICDAWQWREGDAIRIDSP